MEDLDELRQSGLIEETPALKDALLSLTALNQNTILLDYGHVIIRRNYEQLTNVHLLSGGIAGMHLSYASFVGKGMLSAAVLGDEVAPTSRLILRTIKELHEGQKSGIFVICRQNSEMFNFNLAVQRATADCHIRVKLLSVDTKASKTCGFIILIKILGAMAEEGAFYEDMWNCYKEMSKYIISVSLHYKYLQQTRKRKLSSVNLSREFDTMFSDIIDRKSQSNLHLHPSIPIVALINTPKSLEVSAELALAKQVIDRLRHLGVCVARMYLGNFASVTDGASLTVLQVLNDTYLKYIDAPCQALGWQHVTQFLPEVTLRNVFPGLLTKLGKQEIYLKGPKLTPNETNIFVKSLQFACEALISCERQLNIMDGEKSNGDVGTRLRKFAVILNKKLDEKKLPKECPYAFFKKLSVIVEIAMGGTLGSIYAVMFDKAAHVFEKIPEEEKITADTWTKALEAAEEGIMVCLGNDRGQRTMYVPIKACLVAVTENVEADAVERYGTGVSQAEESVQHTKMSMHQYADAGAHAVGIWMRAVYEGVKLMCLGEIT